MSEIFGVEFSRLSPNEIKTPAQVISNEIAYANTRYKFAPGLLKEFEAMYGNSQIADVYRWYARLLSYAEGNGAGITKESQARPSHYQTRFHVNDEKERAFYDGALLGMHTHLSLVESNQRQFLMNLPILSFEVDNINLTHPSPEQQLAALQAKERIVDMLNNQPKDLFTALSAFCDDLFADTPNYALTDMEERFYLGYFITAHDIAYKLVNACEYDEKKFYD